MLDAGVVYLWQEPKTGWKQAAYLAKLSASDGNPLWSVSASNAGTVIVAGSPSANNQQGAVYVFVMPASGWVDSTETARLTASDGKSFDNFGVSVALNSKTVIAGSPSAGGTGAAYIFQQPVSGWVSETETAKLTASNGLVNDAFGSTVAIYGFKASVGAPMVSDLRGYAGAVYVFQEPVQGWGGSQTETAELTDSQSVQDEHLGRILAMSGQVIVTNGAESCYNKHIPCGAKVYVEPKGPWVSTTTPTALLSINSFFSEVDSVAITGDGTRIVIGDGLGGWQNNGGAYEFIQPLTGWADVTGGMAMVPKNGLDNGQSVSIVGTKTFKVFVGSPNTDVGQNTSQGAVFVYSGK
jgi:hypothetical protein